MALWVEEQDGAGRDKEAYCQVRAEALNRPGAVDWGGVKSRRHGDPPDGYKGLFDPLSPPSCLPSFDRYLWTRLKQCRQYNTEEISIKKLKSCLHQVYILVGKTDNEQTHVYAIKASRHY